MIYDPCNLPDDPEQLKAIIAFLLQEMAEDQATIDKLTAELRRVSDLFEKFFGRSSEKLPKEKPNDESAEKPNDEPAEKPSDESAEKPSDGSKENGGPATTAESASGRKKRKRNGGGGRRALPEGLPHVERVIEVPEEERRCSCCEEPFKRIGEERSRQLHFRPMELYIVEQVLPKYVASCECSEKRSVSAEPPIRPIDKGIASTSLLAIIVVMKYLDHLPLARQATQLFKRCGVMLSQSSMCRWCGAVADLLFPLYDLMHTKVLESFVIQMDATTVKYMDPLVKGKAKQGTVWGYNGDATRPYAVYDFQVNGTRAGPEAFLKDYSSYLQCDAHPVYDQIFEPVDAVRPPPTEVGCWAHGRRKFYEAREVNKEAFDILGKIGNLYKLERQLKGAIATERHSKRQLYAIPILNDIFAWCRERRDKFLPKDPLFGAIQYVLKHEAALRRYCEDDRLEIDNNAAERVLRLIAIGRKNWLFYGNERGGRTGATLHTILASAKRNGLNEYEYLRDVLDRLADLGSLAELHDLLPDKWKPKSASQ